MQLTFWGVRGSIPVGINNNQIEKSSAQLQKDFPHIKSLGGNTPCVSVELGNSIIIFDAGTGIINYGNLIRQNKLCKKNIYIFLTHTHIDHLLGLKFFKPFFNENLEITIGAGHPKLKSRLSNFLHKDFWPVNLDYFPAVKKFKLMNENELHDFDLFKIDILKLPHPGGSFAYKLYAENKTIIFSTDCCFNEKYFENKQNDILRFYSDADLVIFDTHFNSEDLKYFTNFGHSSLSIGIFLSEIARIKKLAMFHYHPDYSDDKVYSMYKEGLKQIKKYPLELILSYEGLQIDL